MSKKSLGMIFILFSFLFSGCMGTRHYKHYNIIENKVNMINGAKIEIEFYSYNTRNYLLGFKIRDEWSNYDSPYISVYEFKKIEDIVLNSYEIYLNDELKASKKVNKKLDYYKYTLGHFELNSKNKDKIKVIVNITVKNNGIEESNTIEKNFVVDIGKIYKVYAMEEM